jgi:hypothetical protein
MVLIPNSQDLSAASGIINVGFLEQIYHSFMDEAQLDLGRIVTFHLQPEIVQDIPTQGQPQASQYNPFFGGVAAPNTNTRNKGTRNTPRDVPYDAHIRVGPKGADDNAGIGDLKDNEIQLTVVIEALPDVQAALSFSVEGRRYTVDETRPIGFSQRRYLMVFGTEINESTGQPSTDRTIG